MKVLFLQPPMGSWVTWGKHIAINVSHAQMAACIQRDVTGVTVEALDCRAEEFQHEQMLQEIEERQPDLIYLGDAYQMTQTLSIIPHYERAAVMIKEMFPEVSICAGGFYIAANYMTIANETPQYDYVIAGEPDLTVTELVATLATDDGDLSTIKGLCHHSDKGELIVNEYRPLIKDLDSLPMPAYELFPMDKYIGYDQIDTYQEIFTARGCPFGCSFCIDWVTMDPRGNNDWMKHRYKSAKRVVDEMEHLYVNYGVDNISIFDLNFNPSRKRTEAFLAELQERKLPVNFNFLGNAHSLKRDLDLLPELQKCGLGAVIYGLEVTDDAELKKVKKGTTVAEIKEVTEALREMNITSVITWIIGFPDDSARSLKKRFAVLDDIDPDIMALQMLLPVPGIPMYEEVKEFCEITDFDRWNFHEPVVRTKHLAREELGQIASWANREFYSARGRVQRILESKTINSFPLKIFQSYMRSMDDYAKSAGGEGSGAQAEAASETTAAQ
ncbi:MAG: radical SAM protein [Fibrobacterales bacterium]